MEQTNKRSTTCESSPPAKRFSAEDDCTKSDEENFDSSKMTSEELATPHSSQTVEISHSNIGTQEATDQSLPDENETTNPSQSSSIVAEPPPKKAGLNELFKEIILKNVEIYPIKEHKKEDISDSSPILTQSSLQSAAPIGIDAAEPDTSFFESSNDVIKKNENMASSAMDEFVESCDELSSSNKLDTVDSLSEQILFDEIVSQCKDSPNDNTDSKSEADLLSKPEDFSAIEDALKNMISDVEHSHLEPISIDTRDDFLTDKGEVSSSCGLEFQPDAFLVSSTSEDTADLSKGNPDSSSTKPTCFKDAIAASQQTAVIGKASSSLEHQQENKDDTRSTFDPVSTTSMTTVEDLLQEDPVDSATEKLLDLPSSEDDISQAKEDSIQPDSSLNIASISHEKNTCSISLKIEDSDSNDKIGSSSENDQIELYKVVLKDSIEDTETMPVSVSQEEKIESVQMPDSIQSALESSLNQSKNEKESATDSLGKENIEKDHLMEIDSFLCHDEKTPDDGANISKEKLLEEKESPTKILLKQISKCKDEQASDTTLIKTLSFIEPSKSSEDMETECIDSSTVASIGSTDIIDSFAPTPCDSGETSPSLSTPAGSCQASAAPSPLSKPLDEDPNLVSALLDENSMDSNSSLIEKKGSRKPHRKKDRSKSLKRKDPVILDEETRMDAGSNGIPDLPMDEDSQGSLSATSKRKVRSFRCEVIVPESTEVFGADKVAEYMWPLEGFGEHYFIQEQISQYLGIMSFKRKYPDLRRRPIESQEKEYLKDSGFVNEMACDLGLTAVRSEDVFDVMFNDFPSKYEELQRVLRERKELQLKEKGRVEYQMVDLDKSKLQEYRKKAAKNAARWNAAFNRERREERRYAFDLQTFTVHKPISLCKKVPLELTKIGSYPVAVLPGQYTDNARSFTTAELRCMPLSTVVSGPFTAEELRAEAAANASDDESVSASSNGKETTGEKEPEIPPTAAPTETPIKEEHDQARCKECNGTREKNKVGKPEPLIVCGSCRSHSHPTCIELTPTMIEKIESYSWQCMECKTCAQCNDPDDEERMIFCDMCDRGYHIYCVGLRRVPQGRWHCKECAICFSCGSRTPSGNEHIKNAEWQHEYKKEKDVKQLKYACTLCVPCDKYWKRRQFCYICIKVYRSIPEDGMVKCTGCPKYVHREGCSMVQDNERYCIHCFKTRNKTALNHSRIIAAAKKKMAFGY